MPQETSRLQQDPLAFSGKGEMGLLVWEQSLSKKNKSNETTFTSEVTNMVSRYALMQGTTFN